MLSLKVRSYFGLSVLAGFPYPFYYYYYYMLLVIGGGGGFGT